MDDIKINRYSVARDWYHGFFLSERKHISPIQQYYLGAAYAGGALHDAVVKAHDRFFIQKYDEWTLMLCYKAVIAVVAGGWINDLSIYEGRHEFLAHWFASDPKRTDIVNNAPFRMTVLDSLYSGLVQEYLGVYEVISDEIDRYIQRCVVAVVEKIGE